MLGISGYPRFFSMQCGTILDNIDKGNKGGKSAMNCENIRELRTVRSETEINNLLATGKWRVINLNHEDECVVATLARVKA